MADEIASLLIRITGDASDFQSTMQGVQSQIAGFGSANGNASKTTQAALSKVTKGTQTYKDVVEKTKKSLDDKKSALVKTKQAYAANSKEIKSNIGNLKKQQSSIKNIIASKKDELSALEHANSIYNKGSQAYRDNVKAIQWTKNEISTLSDQYTKTSDGISKQEAALKKEVQARREASKAVAVQGKAYRKLSENASIIEKAEKARIQQEAAQKWQSTGESIKEVGEGLDSVTKPLQILAVGAVAGGVAVSKAAMDYETAFTGVKKTIDGTPEQLNAVDAQIRQLAKSTPVSAAELANLAAVGGQLGVGVNDIAKFTETMTAMGVATNLTGEEGASSMARFMNVMGEDIQNIDHAGSAIVALGNNTSTTESEIASMAVRMGKYGKTVNMNTAQVLGYSAALSSMGIEAQLGGSAIGRTWLDIETAVNSGSETLDTYAKYAGVNAQEFAKQWSTDPSGAFNGLIKGLGSVENLTGAMSELGIVNTQDQQIVMALANNYDLLTKCMNLSGTAYSENTALMHEANAAYGTTANQIKLAKNAVVDAGISWGNVLLPEIKSGAQWVGGLADKFGGLDDSQKKAVISGAKTAVVLGAASKVLASGTKSIGGFVEGVGKIKTAFSAGGVLSKAAPVLLGIAKAAGPVALGIAAVTGAVVIGKKAYDSYQEAQMNWSEGMSETAASMTEHHQKWQQLNDLKWEFGDLQTRTTDGSLEGADLENAKARLEEIKRILSEQFHIDVDSGNIDDAIDKAMHLEQVLNGSDKAKLNSRIVNEKLQYDKTKAELPGLKQSHQEKYNDYLNYTDTASQLTDIMNRWTALSDAEKFNTDVQKQYTDEANNLLSAFGMNIIGVEHLATAMDTFKEKAETAEKESEEFDRQVSQSQKTISEYEESCKSAINDDLSKMWIKSKEGSKDFTAELNDMEGAVKSAGFSAAEYAQKAALAQNQINSFGDLGGKSAESINKTVSDYQNAATQFGATSTEIAQGSAVIKNGLNDASEVTPEALNNVLKDFDTYAKDFGLNTQEIALGTSLIQKGFNDVQSAVDAGKIEELFNAFKGNGKEMGLDNSQIIAFAEAMNLIPENKHIEINADGDLSLIENVTEKVAEIDGKKCTISINADGSVDILDTTTGKVTTLQEIGAVSISVDAQGNTTLLDETGNTVATLKNIGNVTVSVDADGNVTLLDEVSEKAQKLINSGQISLRLNAAGDGLEIIDKVEGKLGEIKNNGDVSVNVDVQTDTSLLDDIQSWLFPSAEAAEIETDVIVAPGNINTDSLSAAIEQAKGVEVTTINATADVTVTPSNIDISGVSSAVASSVSGIAAESNVNVAVTANVNGESEVQLLSSAIESVQARNIPVAAAVSGTAEVLGLTGAIKAVPNKNSTVAATVSGTAEVQSLVESISQVESKTVIITANYVTNGVKPSAKGTQNFRGGLAMVNDERGVSDPRELIVDRGRAFIPQGKDVILPLSKGAKVYTASQTKAIMSGMGIPRFAEGKDNSDAFKTAKDDWTHYTKTHAVTVTEELKKWTELAAKFTANIKDAEDIEEELYSITRDIRDEMNELSEEYIADRSFLNDWNSWGDDAVSAFDRVRNREYAYVADQKITEKEANKFLKNLGDDMYDSRVENSKAWLEKQIQYNNLSVDNQMAAIDRMRDYTDEYYKKGLISYQKYIKGMEEIDEIRAKKLADSYNMADSNAQRHKKLSNVFGYADGDSLKKTVEREMKNLDDAWNAGAFSGNENDYWDKRADLLIERNDAIQAEYDREYSEWQTAKDKERTLYDMYDIWNTVGGKTAWLDEYETRLRKFRDEEKISQEEFEREMLTVMTDRYSAQSDALDILIKAQSDYIDEVDERYNRLINKKEEAFDMNTLNRDLTESVEKARVYANAVTQRGKDTYKEATERVEELTHQKEIKALQKAQNDTVSKLRAEYNAVESNKNIVLRQLEASNINVEAISRTIAQNTYDLQGAIQSLARIMNEKAAVQYIYSGSTTTNINATGNVGIDNFIKKATAAMH